jgi:hypothetical protein
MHSAVNRRVLVTVVALLATPAFAGSGTGAIAPGWNIYGDGNVFFFLTGPHDSPECSGIPDRWAFDTTSPVGRSLFATFLMAYSTGKTVTVNGSATGIHSNTEAVSSIYVND